MANPTTNLGMTKPTVGGSTDTWGTTLNVNVVDIIDALFSISGTDVTMSDIKFNSMSVQETGAGTDTVKIQAPSAVSTSYTLTMPAAVGSTNQVLSAADGSGTLAWTSPEVGDITSVADATNGGMTVTNGTGPDVTLGLNFNDLSAAAVNVANDSIAIIDADDSSTKKESIADLATAMGGTGLTGASGTLAVDASQTQITAVGTIATGVWQGTAVANAYLANSTVSYGGVSLALGASDATPAFNLSNATAYTGDSSLVTVGTVAAGIWHGSTVETPYGGTGATSLTDGGILLGSGTGAVTATAVLADGEILIGDGTTDPVALDVGSSTAITILGTVATGVWNGTAIANANLANSTVSYGGISLALGASDATPAFNLSDATAYTGDSSLVTVGTVASGTWNGTAVGVAYGGTAISSYAAGDILYASGSTTLAKLAKGSDTEVLTLASGVPTWAAPTVGDITGVTAGTGLSGGGTSGTVTLNIEAAQTQITSVGTLTSLVATTADINAGTFDGIVGGTTPADGSFTTLSATGNLTQGNWTIASSDGVVQNTAAGTAQKFFRVASTGGNFYIGIENSAGSFFSATAYASCLYSPGDEIAAITPTFSVTGDATVGGTITGSLTGNVTGNASGTAATVTGAAQSSITSVGTNLGVGATPSGELHGAWSHIILGEKGSLISDNSTGAGGVDGMFATDNLYFDKDTGTYAYITTNEASFVRQEAGALTFANAPSGSAGTTPTLTTRFTVDAAGDVSLASGGKLYLDGGGDTYISEPAADQILFFTGGGERLRIVSTQFQINTDTHIAGDLEVTGAVSKGSGSFKIDHPLPAKRDTHHLVHSFIEGPQADLIYRGVVTLSGGAATVDIDAAVGMTSGTFELLCRDVQCFTANEADWTAVRGSVSGSVLTIEAEDASCTDAISWMVIGERKDPHMMETGWTDGDGRVIVEPEKESPAEPDGD
jgi:hypothetical protein